MDSMFNKDVMILSSNPVRNPVAPVILRPVFSIQASVVLVWFTPLNNNNKIINA